MKITYDAEVDALYIQFLETTVTTEHLAEGIAADYDAEGRLAGIEILDAQKRFGGPQTLRQVILEDVGLSGHDQDEATIGCAPKRRRRSAP
jgi:YD repeat-containing protein